MRSLLLSLHALLYRLFRPVLFLTSSEKVHLRLVALGQWLGRRALIRKMLSGFLRVKHPALRQTLAGITFENPIGMAAGFDYEARLTHIIPAIGLGFETVGTITNQPYEGNTPPRLGRLIKSQSLLVNKGFKNNGIDALIAQHRASSFTIPIGLSIGKTNRTESMSQAEAVSDVVSSFTKAEAAHLPFSYYELNISCPNLHGSVEFYSPAHLTELLSAVTALKLSKPLFIKMPINETNEATTAMLEVIVRFPVAGVIFGNLQKDRNNPAFVANEIHNAGKGNFSGKPTQTRSNELIRLAFRQAGTKLIIIGCGGTFSAEDAYTKIKLGASLVQMITGLIYKGPQLPAQINLGLIKLLKRDGLTHISQAIGKDA